jgi:hypothetical protein
MSETAGKEAVVDGMASMLMGTAAGGNQVERSWADLIIISNFYVVPLLRRFSGINHTKSAIGRCFDSIINCFCPNDLPFRYFQLSLRIPGTSQYKLRKPGMLREFGFSTSIFAT